MNIQSSLPPLILTPLILLVMLLSIPAQSLFASGTQPTFTCDNSIYQGYNGPSQLARMEMTASGLNFVLIGDTSHGYKYNSMGFRRQDGYIYATENNETNLLRIGSDGSVIDLGLILGLPDTSYLKADFNSAGEFIVEDNSTFYTIDVTATPPAVVSTMPRTGGGLAPDFATHPTNNGYYSIHPATGNVIRFDPVTGAGQLGVATTLPFTTGFGAEYFDNEGTFYVYKNNSMTDPDGNASGGLFRIDVTTGNTTFMGFGITTGNNDGASCKGGPPYPTGTLSGTVYTDTNGSDSYDNTTETGINAITVTVYFDNGTPSNTFDDTLVATTETAANGSYSFVALNAVAGTTYRVEVDTTDTDLLAGIPIGTTNPVESVTIISGGTTRVDFGFNFPLCNALTGEVNRGFNANSQLRNADKIFIVSSTETSNQRKGHLKAFTIDQFGIPQTTAVWDAADEMDNYDRNGKLFSTHSNGNIVTLDSLDSAVFSHTGLPDAETIVRYTIDPSNASGIHLNGRAGGTYLGPISAGNGVAYLSNDLDILSYLNTVAYRPFSITVQAREERILVSSDDGFLYAIKPNDGSLDWAWIPRSLVSMLHDPATLLNSQVMLGTIDVLDLKDDEGNYASYIVGSYQHGLGHYVLKLDSSSTSKNALESVIWEADERDTNSNAASSPQYGKRSYFSDQAGLVYAAYLITDTDKSAHLRIRSLTDTRINYDIVLDYQATSAPYVMGAFSSGTTTIEKTLYLGDHQGNIYAVALLDSGTLISQSALTTALKNTAVATMNSVASTPVQFIGSSKAYNGTYYLRAQSTDRLTVFRQQSGWKKAWTAYEGGAGTWGADENYTANTNIQALPTGALIENEARIVSNGIVLPASTSPTGSNCYRNAYYYLYNVENGLFPSNRFFAANGTVISTLLTLGKGTPQTLRFSDLPATDKIIGYGLSDQKPDGNVGVNLTLHIKDSVSTGIRSWRELR